MEDRDRRRLNVTISGVPEESEGSASERKAADEEKVGNILKAVTELESDSITRTYRIGRPTPGKSRLLCVALCDETSKKKVLYNARQLRNNPEHRNIYINPDRTRMQQEEMKALRGEQKRRKENGENVVIYRNKVVLKSKIKNFRE